MKTSDFIGNKRIRDQLECLIDSKRFPQAVVIEGEQGTGRKTLARMLAQALVCRGDEKPCGQCAQCRKAQERVHPDVFEYVSATAANSFHIDVVRDVIKDVYVQPNEAAHKVYILANADSMSISAQNALLKVLEEPPSYAVFILTVRSKSKMLPTILSRSVVFSLEGVDCSEGAEYISSKFSDISFADAKSRLETFNGNIGKTIDSFFDGKENEIAGICRDMCRALVDENEYSLLCICSAFQKDRESIVFACEFLKNIFRDALVYGSKSEMISGNSDTAKLLRTRLTRQKLAALMDVCDTLKRMATMNSNNSLLITKICYSLREAAGR